MSVNKLYAELEHLQDELDNENNPEMRLAIEIDILMIKHELTLTESVS